MKKKPILLLFKENEINISELYYLYAKNIPEKKEFWENLGNEEISHAAYININKKNSDTKIIENNFSRNVIKYVMDFVLKEINRTKTKKISHHTALLTSLRIEQSMLEKKYFDIFTPTDNTLEEVFKKLNKETEEHVNILKKELRKLI